MDVVFEGWCCADCLMIVANGDASGLDYHLNEEDAAKRLAEIEAGMNALVEDVPNGYLVAGDDELEFSQVECDVCGERLAGSRHAIIVLGDAKPEKPKKVSWYVEEPLGAPYNDRTAFLAVHVDSARNGAIDAISSIEGFCVPTLAYLAEQCTRVTADEVERIAPAFYKRMTT